MASKTKPDLTHLSLDEQLTAIRARREHLLRARRELEDRPVPRDVAIARLDRALEMIDQRCPLNLSPLLHPEPGHFSLPALDVFGESLLVKLFREQIRTALIREIDRALAAHQPLDPAERDRQLRAIADELHTLELTEERVCRAIEASGREVLRRPDADLDVVLSTEL